MCSMDLQTSQRVGIPGSLSPDVLLSQNLQCVASSDFCAGTPISFRAKNTYCVLCLPAVSVPMGRGASGEGGPGSKLSGCWWRWRLVRGG